MTPYFFVLSLKDPLFSLFSLSLKDPYFWSRGRTPRHFHIWVPPPGTRHAFTNVFQMLFSCKICHGLWEKYELSCDSKISKSLKKKVEKIGLDLRKRLETQEKKHEDGHFDIFVHVRPLGHSYVIASTGQLNVLQFIDPLRIRGSMFNQYVDAMVRVIKMY